LLTVYNKNANYAKSLKESVRCDEIYQRQLVIFTQDQRNFVAVTEENLNRWAEYDEAHNCKWAMCA